MRLLLLLVAFCIHTALAAEPPLTGDAAKLYEQSRKDARFFADAENLKPEVRATSDGKSFCLVWKSTPSPKRWIASLHGAGFPPKGFAADDLAHWHRHLKARDVGIICLQWWLGTGDATRDFFTPEQIHRELDRALASVGAKPGAVMLHGFSRGSANIYAVAGLDAGPGKKWFSLAVASSGGVALNYPPTRALLAGDYGELPLKGTRWITCAGARDSNPDRDGIPGMKRTADWLREQGANVVFSIEDETSGHGALMLNPANTKRVLDEFMK